MDEKENTKVVTVNTNVKKVVTTKEEDLEETQQTMEEHMKTNSKNLKLVVDWKTLFTYLILIIIVAISIWLIFYFYDEFNKDVIPTADPTTKGLYTTTTSSEKIHYEKPTTTELQPTHTVFDGNR